MNTKKVLVLILLLTACGLLLQTLVQADSTESADVTIEILNQKTGEYLPAWIVIASAQNDNINGWYPTRGRKGFPSISPQQVNVPVGNITVSAWNNESAEVKETFKITGSTDTLRLYLDPWIDLHSEGYFSFDSHNHLNGYEELNRPPFIYPYTAAMGIDHLDLGQGWLFGIRMPVSYDSLITYFDHYSTSELNLRFGAETPKLRYGHTWYVNHPGLEEPFNDYLKWHDVAFVDTMSSEYTRQKGTVDLRGTLHPTWNPPFADRLRYKKEGAFTAIAHPTRWWNSGENQLFPVPNHVADLTFDLLVAGSYDGLVVMGDNKDNIFYQNLWFNLLNHDYRLVPVAETDGNIAGGSLGYNMLTYAKTNQKEFDFYALLNAIKDGHTTLSGKALMLLTVDGHLPPGSELPADGEKHSIEVTVYSEPFEEEFVSFLLLFRNGELLEKVDFRDEKKKEISHRFEVEETETAWYVVKSYGMNYPGDDIQFDVIAYANESMETSNNDYVHNSGVSFTAPVFFNGPDWKEPERIESEITITFVDDSGQPLQNFPVEVWNIDTRTAQLETDFHGKIEINAPATVDIRYTDFEGDEQQKWLFYEYPPLLDIIESIYTLSYLEKYPAALPGQIPWEMFQYEEIKEVISVVDWEINIHQ